jgi:hypothetical protein
MGDYNPSITLTPQEIMYKKTPPYILLPLKDKITRKCLFYFPARSEERHYLQLRAPRRQEKKERKIAGHTSSSALSCQQKIMPY